MTERKTEKIALGWTRAEIVDRFARIMRNAMGPEFWAAPPPEWAERAAETIWQNVEAMVRDRLETDRAEIELLRAKLAALPESADEGLREAVLFGPQGIVFPRLPHHPTGPDVLDAVASWMDRKDDEWEAEQYGRVPLKANRDVQAHLREWARRLRAALAATQPATGGEG